MKPGEGERDAVFETRLQWRSMLIKKICQRPHSDGWHSAMFRGFDASQVFSKV